MIKSMMNYNRNELLILVMAYFDNIIRQSSHEGVGYHIVDSSQRSMLENIAGTPRLGAGQAGSRWEGTGCL